MPYFVKIEGPAGEYHWPGKGEHPIEFRNQREAEGVIADIERANTNRLHFNPDSFTCKAKVDWVRSERRQPQRAGRPSR